MKNLNELTITHDATVDNIGTNGDVAWTGFGVDKDGNEYKIVWLPTEAWVLAEKFAKAEIAGDKELMAELIEENGGDNFVDVQDQSNACDWDVPYEIEEV